MKMLLSVFLLSLVVLSLPAFANSTNDALREKQFLVLSQSSITSLEEDGPLEISNRVIDFKALSASLKSAKLQWTDEHLKVNGVSVDAINVPSQKLIIINRAGWDAMEQFSKSQLSLHELWGLTFNDHQDDSYLFSSQMMNKLKRSSLSASAIMYICEPRENKNDERIYVHVGIRLFLTIFFGASLDDKPFPELASFANWVDEVGKVSRKSRAFVNTSKNLVQVERYPSPINSSYEELHIPVKATEKSIRYIYSATGSVSQKIKYNCESIL